jgi:uncharacterized protein (DUF1015 family)
VAEVRPLNALHYVPAAVGSIADVTAPPYDVITPEQRVELLARSPFNVVEIDLPEAAEGADPYEHAGETLQAWTLQGILTADREPAIWALEQEFTGPDGGKRARRGFLARVRLAPYGPGGVRPHERTQPGPKEDRLRLTRATRHNLSPIFSLHSGNAWQHIAPALPSESWAEVTDADGTVHRVWRLADPAVHDAIAAELAPSELLIADGHHRYETALAYEREVGDAAGEEGPHSYILMALVSLDDPGLAVFPTHRLLYDLKPEQHEILGDGLKQHFEIEEVPTEQLDPAAEEGIGVFGYIDAHLKRGFRLRLKDASILEAALPDEPDAYRTLDAVILEELVFKRTLGMSTDDIAAKRGLAYISHAQRTIDAIHAEERDCAFLLRATPVEQVRAVAAAGETMPPKSTYFFPKLLTGLVFNPLS